MVIRWSPLPVISAVPADPFPALFCALEADPVHCIPRSPVPCGPVEFGLAGNQRVESERGLHHWWQLCSSTPVVPITSLEAWQYRLLPLLLQVSWPHPDAGPGSLGSSPRCKWPFMKCFLLAPPAVIFFFFFNGTFADILAVIVTIRAPLGLSFPFLGRTPATSFISSLCCK